jgi:hypothetical protein
VAGTSVKGADHGHRLIDTGRLEATEIRYPTPVRSDPVGLGDGTWLTAAPDDRFILSRWRRPSG